jgi:hypothetical protein
MPKVYSESGKYPKRVDDYVIYPNKKGEMILQKKTGFTSDKMKNDPKYEKSRNNASEFGRVSARCKQLRILLKDVLPKRNNLDIVNALVTKMRQVMVMDKTSGRGERNLGDAFRNKEARSFFLGYHFNPAAEYTHTFRIPYTVSSNGLSLSIGKFSAKETVSFPGRTNSAGVRLHGLYFDFNAGEGTLASSDRLFFGCHSTVDKTRLMVPAPDGNGVLFSILELQFFIDDQGSYVPVEDGKIVCVIRVVGDGTIKGTD